MGSPFCAATLLFVRRTAPAPSLTWLALPRTPNSKPLGVEHKVIDVSITKTPIVCTSSCGPVLLKRGFQL